MELGFDAVTCLTGFLSSDTTKLEEVEEVKGESQCHRTGDLEHDKQTVKSRLVAFLRRHVRTDKDVVVVSCSAECCSDGAE